LNTGEAFVSEIAAAANMIKKKNRFAGLEYAINEIAMILRTPVKASSKVEALKSL